MKNIHHIVLVFCSLWALSQVCGAYPDEYGPFEPHGQPDLLPVQECIVLNQSGNAFNYQLTFAKDGAASVHLVLSTQQKNFQLQVLTTSGEVLLPTTDIWGHRIAHSTVYWADLNDDMHDDYIIETWSGGSGLAAYRGYFTMLLSSGQTFKILPMMTMSPNVHDFVILAESQTWQFIHTAFVSGEAGKDGARHNYWVHNLFELRDNDLVLANKKDSQFPKWILYSYDPNHTATTQLTEEQKSRLLHGELGKWIPSFRE